MKNLFCSALLTGLFSLTALASTTVSVSPLPTTVTKWSGSGVAYAPNGQQIETYQIEIVNTALGGGVTQSDASILSGSGVKKTFTQTITQTASGWTADSSIGKGGGQCYGVDVCENYIAGTSGLAYATTIFNDGPNLRRQITFELQNGQAVRVMREKLVRVK